MDLSQIIVFSAIQSEQQAKGNLDLLIDIVGGGSTGKQFSKQKTKQFFNMMNTHLQSKQAPPKSKFYSLYMIKLIIQRSLNKFLSIFASHSILKYLHQLAKQTDPNKPITEKGKNLFPDKQLGNDYIRLILQTLKILSQNSKSSNSQPTKFKKIYDSLIQMNIVLPKQLKYYNPGGSGGSAKSDKKNISNNQIGSVQRSRQSIKNGKQGSSIQPQYKQDIDVSISKINTYVQVLKTQQDAQSLRQQCQLYHKRFIKQKQKYQKILNTADYTNDNNANLLFALNQFYLQQNNYYQEFLPDQKDYNSYISAMLMTAETLYQALGNSPPVSPVQYPKEEKPLKKSEQASSASRKNNFMKQPVQDNKQVVSKLMTQLNQKSKPPTVGFKAIKQSLSKQKSLSRNKRSVSGFKKSNATKFGKSMSKSKIAQIFSSPPNQYPKQKRYDGQQIQQNRQLQKVMRQISKKQGIRRFITCNFKQKNPLFQNTHIQIGVKSQPIYQDVNGFKVLIGIELYIGNKTQDLIKNMSINYKGNQDVLLYANPRTIQTVLMGGYQHKHELLIVPVNYQFPFIKMYLKYSIHDQTIYQNIILPNSIIKLASHGSLQKRQFIEHWNQSIIYKTSQFKWTHHITPDSVSKYIKPIQQLTAYDKFIAKGSQSDLQLGCRVILKQRYQGVLRINIRPNFNAIIQVGSIQNNQQAIQSFIYYAQTLKMLLTHTDHQQL